MNEQGRILIIDDEKSDAEEFERVLRSEGYEVETAATAEAGLARATRETKWCDWSHCGFGRTAQEGLQY
jgi:CheY-like chemotaxis protein